jgi:HK97 family phage prohead protease
MSSNNIEFKAIPGQFNIDEAQGMVECFVAGIGNKDSVGDVLVPGAFTESLKRRKPRVVWGHNWNDPIGKVLEIYEVAPNDPRLPMKMKAAGIGGLYARVQFNLNSEKGREAFANVAFFGQEQEWSIGYKTLDAIHDPALKANILKEVELYEVSPVLHGANQLTGTISVKSDETAEKCGPGMGMMGQQRMPMGSMPQVVVVRQDDDEDNDKPIFSEGLARPLGDEQKNRLARELQSRSGSSVQLIQATDSTAVFKRTTSDGRSTMYRIGYHTPDNYVTFMFGKPELADAQMSGSRVVVPSQMPSMPMQVKPQPNAYMGEEVSQNLNIANSMPNSDSYEKTAFDQELEDIEEMLSEEFDVKVGRALNSRNLSKLKNIMQSLQEIIAASEKEIDTKSELLIPVELENAFQTKQLLDPIFDYHRVESQVTEDGILITSPVSEEFVDAVDTAVKALGGRIGGDSGKGRRAARGLTARFDPTAWDGDGDGLVQEGTAFQRPAIPGVNDRASGGRVNPSAATRAFRQEGGMASASWQLPRSQEDEKGIQVLDSQILKERMSGMSLDEAAKKFNIPKEQIRQREAREMARLRLESDPRDIVAYRLQGLSLEETGKMFGKSREEIRQIEAKEIARFKKDTTDADILEYRERGLSLDEVAKISGLEKTEVRKREMAAIRNKPEIPEPDKPMDDDTIKKMQAAMARDGGMLSRAEVVSKNDLPENIVNDVSNAAVRAVGSKGDETRLIDGAKEVLANLTDEKLKDSIGKSVSNSRRKLSELLSDEKIIEEFSSEEALDDFMDEMQYAIQKMLDLHIDSVKKTETASAVDEIKDIVDNANSDLDDDFNKLTSRAKDFWGKRRKPGEFDKTPEEAKKEAELDRKLLMNSIKEGGEPEDLAETLRLMSGVTLTRNQSEEIIDGKMSLEDFNYELERAIEGIIENDPSIESEEIVNELADSLREGASKDGANPLIVSLAKEFGDEKITGGDLIDYLNDTRKDSVYRPDRGKVEKEKIRGLASRSGKPVLGRDISYFEPEDDRSEAFYDMARDVTRAEMDRDYYEMVQNAFEGSVFGAINGENPSASELEARKQIVDNLDSVIKKAEETIGRPDKAFDRLDEIAKLPKQERLAALRDADLEPNERQILENGLMEDYFADKKSDLFDDIDKQMVDSIAESMMEGAVDEDPRRGGGMRSSSRTMLNRPGQIQRDERGNVDPTEAREARAAFDQGVFKKLRDLGFTDDDIETLTGVPNGGIVPEGAKPASYSGREGGMASRSGAANISKMNDSDLRSWANQNLEDSKKRQTRMADMKARGMSMDDIAKEFPTLSRSQIAREIASGDKRRTSGMRSSNEGSYSLELTSDEFSTLADDLEFMGLDEISDKFREAGKDRDSNQISISPEELDEYISSVDKWADDEIGKLDANNATDGGATANLAGDVSDVLSRLKKSTGRKFTSENVEQDGGRKFRAGGSINPHEKLEFGLTEDEVGLLVEEMDLFSRTEPNNRVITQALEKMKAAKNGKFSFTAEEADELDKELGRIADENDFTGLDMSGILGQAADSKDGKLITNGSGKRGLASAAKPGRKPNNGAPMDINEQMQKELIFWAKRNQNLFLAKKWTDSFDANDGQLSSRDWRGLETLFNNLSPRGRRGGSRSVAKPRGDGTLSRSVGMRSGDDSKPLSPINSGGPSMTPTGEGRELPTSRVLGLGDIGYRGPAEEGRPVGTREDPRFIGKTFDETKPSNWSQMGLEEKYEWLFSDGQPQKSGMREVDFNKTLNDLLQEEERMERQNARKNRGKETYSDSSPSREGGMSSRAQDISSRAKEEDMPKKITDLLDSVVKKLNGYEENKDKLPKMPTQSRESGMLSRSMGMPSKAGRTMITDEATYFKDVEDSLAKEISKAREANDSKGASALSTLQQIIRRQEASKLGDRRTNVGSIYFTADEADQILDALMGVVDRQVARNDQKRIEIFAKLVDMMATAAMSTFVDKDTAEVNSRPRSGQVNL